MNQKIINKKSKPFILIPVIFLIVYCGLFIYSSLKSELIYEKVVKINRPAVRSELESYYRNTLSLLSEAIKFNKNNADYLVTKADYLVMAGDDGLKVELSIADSEIEDLYSRAVKLNPINFEYHLKLGWFYADRDDEAAETELIKAIELYPKNFDVYLYLIKYYSQKGFEEELVKAVKLYPRKPESHLYLMKHYLEKKDEKKAFWSMVSFLHYIKDQVLKHATIKDFEQEIANLPNIFVSYQKNLIQLSIYPGTNKFDFKEADFLHDQINLTFKVYVRGNREVVSLYRGSFLYANFEELSPVFEQTVYQLLLNNFSASSYLDDFEIRTGPHSSIEKIEILRGFNR
jgi:tetratricopeptide (TPR) repeat protein